MEIRCPQCDASIEVGTENIITKCPYCSVPLYYEKDSFLTKESIKPTHDSSVAERLLEKITGKKLKVRMKYFPFYRIKAENRTDFIPGKKINAYRIGSYVPQGDRIPLDMDVEKPDFNVEIAMKRAGVEKAEKIELVYAPFFTARDNDTYYYVDAAKGNILSNKILESKLVQVNKHPLALMAFAGVALFSIFIPNLVVKILMVLMVTGGFWYYEKDMKNA